MQTYEFNTIIHDGIIRIPKQYLDKQLSSIKVIIFPNINDTNMERGKKFTAMKLKTKGFKFNREEANER
jgi:ribosomal protein L31E